MAATPTQNRAAIEPGSTPFGERQTLESGLTSVTGGGGGVAPSPGPVTPRPSVQDPMGALLAGSLPVDSAGPITSGLSVGPGHGPLGEQSLNSDTASRLRFVAQNAKTPHLRATARNALRRLVRVGDPFGG